MTDVAASVVLDFEKANKNKADSIARPYKIFIEPNSLNVGDSFVVSLYAPDSYLLKSPYNGIIGGKTIAAKAIEHKETISLSGNVDISTKYPVDELISAVVANALVSESSREVEYGTGESIKASIHNVNSALKLLINEGFVGSLNIVYTTFKAQEWKHKAFQNKGAAVLFAQNESSKEWINHQLTIQALTEDAVDNNVQILAHNSLRKGAYDNYRVYYNKSRDFKLITSTGRSEFVGNYLGSVNNEKIKLSGALEISTKFYVVSLSDFKPKGYFFDENGKQVSAPSFNFSNGKLKLNKKVWGVVVISYKARYALYDYFTQDVGNSAVGFKRTLGSILAFKKGAIAEYDIPKQTLLDNDSFVAIRIYSKVLAGENDFEFPPEWPEKNSFPSYPSAPEDNLPPLGEQINENERDTVIVTTLGGTITTNIDMVRLRLPFRGFKPQNHDIKFIMELNIPEGTDPFLINKINAKARELKTEYSIS